jgi:S-(hydroxymethyl)glutathione dehydrogenase/alcohol dehydrogenase
VSQTEAPDVWRAALLRSQGQDLEVVEIHRPVLQRGQVLVKVLASGVCRSQLMEVRGLRGEDRWLPHLLGHEGVGVVAGIGPGVTKVHDGDRVILGWIAGTGIEANPPSFLSVGGEPINAGRVTTFSEYTVVSENRVYLAPGGLGDKTAVLFGCALLTGAGMVLNETSLEPGQSVLVSGAGGIGLAALLALVALGVSPIVADPDSEKREMARVLGASHTFDPLSQDESSDFQSRFPKGVDIALDASGAVSAMEFAFRSIKYEGGLLLFASHPPAGEFMKLDPHELIRGKQIRGSWGGASQPDRDIAVIADLLMSRRLDLEFMTPYSYTLDEINTALKDLELGKGIRPLIRMNVDE